MWNAPIELTQQREQTRSVSPSVHGSITYDLGFKELRNIEVHERLGGGSFGKYSHDDNTN